MNAGPSLLFSGFFGGGTAAYYILSHRASFLLRATRPSIFVGSRLPFTDGKQHVLVVAEIVFVAHSGGEFLDREALGRF